MNLSLESFTYPSGVSLFAPAQLTIAAGETVALVGGSGSGKSSLLTLLAGLHPQPLGGRLQGNIDWGDMPETSRDQRLGYMGSDPKLFLTGFCPTVLEEVGWSLFGWGWSPERVEDRVQATLRDLAIDHLAWNDPRVLSGGQQQMVALAAVLARRPPFLLLDEPVSRLDPQSRSLLIRAVRESSERTDVAVVWATSRLQEVDWCQTVWHLRSHEHGLHRIEVAARRLWDPPDTRAVPIPAPLSEAPPPIVKQEPVLQVRSVRYRPPLAERPLFDDLDWRVARGQIEALVGANGAGKTTLARIIRGLTRPSEGSVMVGDQQVGAATLSSLAATIAYTYQDPNSLFLKPTVESELLYSSELLGLEFLAAKTRCQHAVELFELRPWLTTHPRELPASVRGLLSVALAWLTEAKLQILDEPLAHLDQPGRTVLERVLRYWSENGTTTIIIAHDLDWLQRVCSSWTVLHQGRILAQGSALEVFATPEVQVHFSP